MDIEKLMNKRREEERINHLETFKRTSLNEDLNKLSPMEKREILEYDVEDKLIC